MTVHTASESRTDRSTRRTATWTLIYDGECVFCQRQVELIRRWDTHGLIEFVSLYDARLDRLGISRTAAEEAMHFVAPDGTVWAGAEAARQILYVVRRWRPIALIMGTPGVTAVSEAAYRWVARRRHRLGCDSDVCRRGEGN